MSVKRFHIGDVLTVVTGNVVSPRGLNGVYDILQFMIGDHLHSYEILSASRLCKPAILRQYPQLSSVTTDSVIDDASLGRLKAQAQLFGETLLVETLQLNARTPPRLIVEGEGPAITKMMMDVIKPL